MKEVFSLTSKCILVFMLIALGTVGGYACDEELLPYEPPKYDFVADGIYYNILSETDLTLEVTKGEGYTASVIEIPAHVTKDGKTYTVTTLGEDALSYCGDSLAAVTLPETITMIGDFAFAYDYSLTQVNIPSSVTSIGNNAFCFCSSLESLELPEGLTTIGYNAFFCCNKISVMAIPSTVTSIGSVAFGGMTSLNDASMPPSTTELPEGIFSGCTTLSKTIIPSMATRITKRAFSGCVNLVDADIPSNVTEIDTMAFYYNLSLSSVTIPANVTNIAKDAFWNCTALTDVYLEHTTPPAFYKSFAVGMVGTKVTVHIPAGSAEAYRNSSWPIYCTLVEETTGISIAASSEAAGDNAVERYALDGCRLNAASKGFNIVKMSDGSVRKVMVR